MDLSNLEFTMNEIEGELAQREHEYQVELETNPKLRELKAMIVELNEQAKTIKAAYDLLQNRAQNKDCSTKLRFDIYERITTNPPHKAIKEVVGKELKPSLKYFVQDDTYLIRGSLNLLVEYISLEDVRQWFEYGIPVEISIPLSRTSNNNFNFKVDNLCVEIVGRRTLNVTGVLVIEF